MFLQSMLFFWFVVFKSLVGFEDIEYGTVWVGRSSRFVPLKIFHHEIPSFYFRTNVMSSNWQSGTGPPVHLLHDGLVVGKGPNISVRLAAQCLGGPFLAPDLGLYRTALFNPLPHGEFIFGMRVTASVNPTYGSCILR